MSTAARDWQLIGSLAAREQLLAPARYTSPAACRTKASEPGRAPPHANTHPPTLCSPLRLSRQSVQLVQGLAVARPVRSAVRQMFAQCSLRHPPHPPPHLLCSQANAPILRLPPARVRPCSSLVQSPPSALPSSALLCPRPPSGLVTKLAPLSSRRTALPPPPAPLLATYKPACSTSAAQTRLPASPPRKAEIPVHSPAALLRPSRKPNPQSQLGAASLWKLALSPCLANPAFSLPSRAKLVLTLPCPHGPCPSSPALSALAPAPFPDSCALQPAHVCCRCSPIPRLTAASLVTRKHPPSRRN